MLMKRYVLLLLPLLLSATLLYSQPYVWITPRWYRNPPEEQGKIVGVGRGTSSNKEVALRKAIMDANIQIAKQVQPALTSIASRLDTLARGNEMVLQRITLVRTTVQAELTNTRIVRRAFKRANGGYIAFVLIEMSTDELRAAFIQRAKDDPMLTELIAAL